jgi:type IV pilus assembly protein PilV
MCKTRHSQRGFTLLEVLVALVILSIGLIGLAGLQSASLKQNYNAYLRSQATALAYNMADRVRANALGASSSNYNGISGTATSGCVSTSGCTEADMAANDVFEWNADLASLLPLGEGEVCVDSTPEQPPATLNCDGTGPTHVVRVSWDDNRSGDVDTTSPAETIIIAFRP